MTDMNRILTLCCLLLLIPGPPAGGAPDSAAAADPSAPLYSRKTPSRDGIGKVYMGREISFVMGHRGMGWLERDTREREERTDLVVENMKLSKDAVVADIGAGSGYFTFRISPRVPRGRVLAVDIQQEMLDVIERRRSSAGALNVQTVLGTPTDPNLPPESVDAALMVDAYHEFSDPREMMNGLVAALKPGGHVFLVEYREEDPSVPILPLHKMSEAQARLELEAVGLEFVENRSMLPQQHFLIFRKPGPES